MMKIRLNFSVIRDSPENKNSRKCLFLGLRSKARKSATLGGRYLVSGKESANAAANCNPRIRDNVHRGGRVLRSARRMAGHARRPTGDGAVRCSRIHAGVTALRGFFQFTFVHTMVLGVVFILLGRFVTRFCTSGPSLVCCARSSACMRRSTSTHRTPLWARVCTRAASVVPAC